MAIKLATNFKGVNAEYWKILETKDTLLKGETEVILGLYLNAATRQLDVKNILDVRVVKLKAVDLARADIYSQIKLLDEFKTAVDA